MKRIGVALAYALSVLLLAACRAQTPPPTQPLVVAATATLVSPPSASLTPTISASPSPAFTATAAVLPTPAPITPAGGPDAYQLAAWSPDQADKLIAKSEATILETDTASPGTMLPYRAAWYAVWDALAHFPDDPRADGWRWKLPYYMALAGDGAEATQWYAALISAALNEQGIVADDLPAWFQSGEEAPAYLTPPFELEVSPIAIPGHAAGYLIALGFLHDIDTPGSSCLLAVQDGNNSILYPLHNGFPGNGFFVTLRNPSACFAQDVTDDGIAEIIIDQYSGGHMGWTEITVLDITQLPPTVMPFNPAQDHSLSIWNGGILDYPIVEGRIQLEVGEQLGFCDEYAVSRYQWNGQWFEVTSGRVEFGEHFAGGDDALFSCLTRIVDYARGLSARDATAIFDQAYRAYAPTITSNREMLEELRILQGLYSGYNGELESARAVFNDVAQSPTVSNSVWIRPAQDFVSAFDAPADLYCACATVNICAPYYAQYTIGESCIEIAPCEYAVALPATVDIAFSASPLAQITDQLRTAGAQIPVEGWFDFDADGRDERWFSVVQPGEAEPQLWIAAEYSGGVKALLVSQLLTGTVTFTRLSGDAAGTLTDIGNGQTLKLVRHPLTGEPFAIVRTPETREPLIEALDHFKALRAMLLQGSAAAPVYEQLLELDQAYLTCPFQIEKTPGTIILYYDCAAYRYTFALAAELAGRPDEAIMYYQAVLRDYPLSAFAQLARARLGS